MPKGIQKTTEEFKQEVYDLVGDEYRVLEEYQRNDIKLLMRHTTCGYKYYALPKGFLRGRSRCPKCFNIKNFSKTDKKFKQEVYDLVGNEYEVLREYKNSSTKILVKHNKCGYEYKVNPHNFLIGCRCPKCAGNMNKDTEYFRKEVFELVGNEYSILGEYVNTSTKILIKHNKCGHEYDVVPHSFLRGYSRCPKCFGNPKKTTEEFKQEVYDLVGDEYRVLEEYQGSCIKILMRHTTCGYKYYAEPHSFLRGYSRCPKCFNIKSFSKTDKKFKQEIHDLVGDEYSILGEYKNSRTKILVKHNKCGHEYDVIPNSFLKGYSRCPICICNKRGPKKKEKNIKTGKD